VRNAYDVPEVLREMNVPTPGLITIAQALHWFDPDKLYQFLPTIMNDSTALCLIAYSTSLRISDGTNWTQLVQSEIPNYQVFNGYPEYKFREVSSKYHQEADEALQVFWNSIYKHMHASIP
jgi:hypothetical protein